MLLICSMLNERKKVNCHRNTARPGDYLEFFAEINLIGGLSACPGGDCGSSHSSEDAQCHPLKVEIYKSDMDYGTRWSQPDENGYDRTHGG